MTKVIAIGIARMNSSRLPGKILMPLGPLEYPVISWVARAATSASLVDEFIVATTTDKKDNAVEEWCNQNEIFCYRGSEDDVLDRFYQAARTRRADIAVRLTCDCPLLDHSIIDQVIALREATKADYASNIDPPTFADGMDCEAIHMDALFLAHNEAKTKIDRECVTSYIYRNRHRFHCESLICPLPDMHKERWVLDTQDDYDFCTAVANAVPTGGWLKIKRFLDKHPEVRKINAHHPRNERFYAALAAEPIGERRDYGTSKTLLARAERTIPLAAQTFSKSKIQYPADSPLFVSHGDGGYCFDVDGNRYVDLVGGLLPVILGHRDPNVDYAVRRQLNCGISHSLSTELEAELAETLCRLIPSAEMVRFGKNGTDATTAAVRLSRVHTGRDLVLSAGYHGWADWSVAWDETRAHGVPLAVVGQTVPFKYGDERIFDLLKDGKFACVVVEPETNPEYLRELREACDKTGTVLVFDEIITWPRWGLGGAQGSFRVTPDLTCISKAMANGMPISALVGKKHIMQDMVKTSFSGTFFGETLSLAAAIATIKKLENEPIIDALLGAQYNLARAANGKFAEYEVPIFIEEHHYGLPRLSFKDQNIKTLFIQEMAQAGTLIIASHNLSYAHGKPEIDRVLRSYDHALGIIKDALESGDIMSRINGIAIPKYASVRASIVKCKDKENAVEKQT